MLTQTGLLQEINQLSKSGWSKTTGKPCEWEEHQGKYNVKRKTFLRAGLLIGFNAISMIVGVLQTTIHSKLYGTPVDLKTMSMSFLIPGSAVMMMSSFINYKEPEMMEGFISQLVEFENRQLQQETKAWKSFLKKRTVARLALLTCKISRINTITIGSVLAGGSSAVMPDLPFNMLRFYPSRLVLDMIEFEVVGWGLSDRVGWGMKKVVTFLWNLVFWEFLGKYWCMLVAQIETGCVGLSGVILSLNRQVQKGLRTFSEFADTHRQIQILTIVFNKIQSSILVILLISVSQAQIVSGLNLIAKKESPFGQANVSLTIFSTMIFSNGFFALNLIYGICGEVHATSTESLKRMRGMLERDVGEVGSWKSKRYKWMLMRSLPVIKVHFGGMNFIEKLTPVMFQNFTMLRLIDCMLLSKSY